MCKWKNKTCKNGEKKEKENDGGSEFNYDIFDIL
jgi:hypothetical protein